MSTIKAGIWLLLLVGSACERPRSTIKAMWEAGATAERPDASVADAVEASTGVDASPSAPWDAAVQGPDASRALDDAAAATGHPVGDATTDIPETMPVDGTDGPPCVNGSTMTCAGCLGTATCTNGSLGPCSNQNGTRECSAAGLKGPCANGDQTCQSNGNWSTCSIPPKASDTCSSTTNDDNCNGVPFEGCGCTNGDSRGCGSCGGMQTCSNGVWSACSNTPPDYGKSCGKCGGSVLCSGQCSLSAGPVQEFKTDTSEQVCVSCGCQTVTKTAGGFCPGSGMPVKCTVDVSGAGAKGGSVIGWKNPLDPHSCACEYSYTFCPAQGYTFVAVTIQYQPCQ